MTGNFDIEYKVTDVNECSTHRYFFNVFKVNPAADPNFSSKQIDSCSKAKVLVTNNTSLDTSKVKSWHYQIGDFKTHQYSKRDLSTKWLADTFNVLKDGIHDIKLVVERTDNCKDSFIMVDAIKVFNPDLNVEILNTSDYLCLNDSVHFKWNKSETVDEFIFTFGDPLAMAENYESNNPNPSHKYVGGSGSYNLSLSTKNYGCQNARDTSICSVNINGPTSIIDLPRAAFNLNNPTYNKHYLLRLNLNPKLDSQIVEIEYYKKVVGRHYR